MRVDIVNYTGIGYNDVKYIDIKSTALISIDGSTSTTGLSIIDTKTKGLLARMSIIRDEISESPVRYKLQLKKLVLEILQSNSNIKYIFYEEPCIYHKSAVKNLFMLRSFIEEMIIENEPTLDYIQHFEVANTRWKKIFLYPDKISNNTELDKQKINERVKGLYSLSGNIDLNQTDAIGLGYAACEVLNGDKDFELESKKKPTKFLYNIVFSDEEYIELVIEDLLNNKFKIPAKLFENGIKIKHLNDREDLDTKIYTELQNEDCILVMDLNKLKHGDIVLKYNLGSYVNNNIHTIVWRKTRKKLKQY